VQALPFEGATAAVTWHLSPGFALVESGRAGAEVSLLRMQDRFAVGFAAGVDDVREDGARYAELEGVYSDFLAPRGRFYHVVTLGAGPRWSPRADGTGWQATLGVALPPLPPLLFCRWIDDPETPGRAELGVMLKLPIEL
jgi:hypothetical protein